MSLHLSCRMAVKQIRETVRIFREGRTLVRYKKRKTRSLSRELILREMIKSNKMVRLMEMFKTICNHQRGNELRHMKMTKFLSLERSKIKRREVTNLTLRSSVPERLATAYSQNVTCQPRCTVKQASTTTASLE